MNVLNGDHVFLAETDMDQIIRKVNSSFGLLAFAPSTHIHAGLLVTPLPQPLVSVLTSEIPFRQGLLSIMPGFPTSHSDLTTYLPK